MNRIEISSIEIQPIDRTTCNVRLELSFNDGSWNTFKNKSFIHYSNEIYSTSVNDYQDDDFSGDDDHHVIKEIMIEESNFVNKSITISDFNVFYTDSSSNHSDDKTESWNTYAFNTIHISSGNLPETSPVHQVEVYGTLHQPEISSVDKLKNAYVLKVKVNSHSESRLEGFLVTIGGAIFTDLNGIDAIDISYDSLLDDAKFEEYKIKSYYVPKSDVADTRTIVGENFFYDIRVCDPSYAISDISKGQVNRMVFNEVDDSTLHFTKFLTENSVSLIDVSNHQTLESNSVEANGNSSINTFNNVRAYTGDAGKVSTLADGATTGYQDNSGNTTDLMQYINYDSSGVASYGAIKIYADAPSEMLSNYPYEARLFWIQDPSGGISTNDAATYLKDQYNDVSNSTSTGLKDKISSDWTCVENITYADISNGYDISGLNDGKPVYFFIQSYDTINNRYTRVDFLKNIGKITPHAPPPRITSASPSIHGTSLTDSSQNDPLYQNSNSIHVDFSLNEHYDHGKVGDLTSIMVLFADILVNEYDISDVVTDMNNNHQGSDLSASIAYRLNLDHNNDTRSSSNLGTHYSDISRNQRRPLTADADLSLGLAFTTEYFPFTLSPSDVSFSDDVNIQLREQPAALTDVSFDVIHGTGGTKGRVKVSATGDVNGNPIPVQILIEDPITSNKLFNNDSVNISNAVTGTNWYVFDASMTHSSGGVYDVSFESPYDNQAFNYQVARTTSSYKLNNSINNGTVIPDDLSRNTNGVADLFRDLSWASVTDLTTKHAPTHDISISSAPTDGNSNDISSVTLTITETARDPDGLGDTSANTFLVLYPVNNTGNPDLQDLSFALSEISERDASLNDASANTSGSYTVTFNVPDISYGQNFKLLFTNDVSGSTGVETGKLYTRTKPNPPTLNWKEYSSSYSDASGNDWETPTTIKYLEITLPNTGAGNYGGDPSYNNDNYVYNIDVSGNGQTHTALIKHDQITSTTGVIQAHAAGGNTYMPASAGQPIYLQFTDLSENTNYNFNVTLKSMESGFVSDGADISASTDITLTNFDDGDFALDLTINKNIATESGYTDINVEECTLDVSFTFSGDGVDDGTNVYGYYIIANISGQPFVILSKDLSDQTVSSRNSFNDSHTFDVNNPFGTFGGSPSLPGLLMPELTDISNFDVNNGHIMDLKDQNDISGELNYPRYGIDITYSVRVAFIDQENNKYTDFSYNPSSGSDNALMAETDVGSTILSSFPIITNVKVDLSNNKILKLDISLNQQGEEITHFMILSPNTGGNNMHHDLTIHVNNNNYPLFGNHHYQTVNLNLDIDVNNKDIILFIQNNNGANLYYLDNFDHDTNYNNNTGLNLLNNA